jgi:hypothetical protein
LAARSSDGSTGWGAAHGMDAEGDAGVDFVI